MFPGLLSVAFGIQQAVLSVTFSSFRCLSVSFGSFRYLSRPDLRMVNAGRKCGADLLRSADLYAGRNLLCGSVTRGYPHAVPAGENADLGHTATGQSETCKADPQIRPAPQIQPTPERRYRQFAGLQ